MWYRYVIQWHIDMLYNDIKICYTMTYRYVMQWHIYMLYNDIKICYTMTYRYVIQWHIDMLFYKVRKMKLNDYILFEKKPTEKKEIMV